MDDYLTCKLCNGTVKNLDALSNHLKNHKVAQKRYFETHFPKFDLGSKQSIKFKSLEQWILADFCDKRTMKGWLSKVGKEKATKYLVEKLKTYMKLKKWNSPPSESVMRSISCLPSIQAFEYYSEMSFERLCQENGLNTPYLYSNTNIIAPKINQIVVDTREKRPLKFKKSFRIVNMALSYGDYAQSSNSKVVVERKSSGDFFGTMSSGYDRFVREVGRAIENNGYIVVVVETSLTNALYMKRRFGKINPDWIFHRVRDLVKNHSNHIQFLFCDGRVDAAKAIPLILGLKDQVKKIDIQYSWEKGFIK